MQQVSSSSTQICIFASVTDCTPSQDPVIFKSEAISLVVMLLVPVLVVPQLVQLTVPGGVMTTWTVKGGLCTQELTSAG